jgi:hypothetical protein
MIPIIITLVSILTPVEVWQLDALPNFYYMEVESEDSTSYEAVYGQYFLSDEGRVEKQDPQDIHQEEFIHKLDSTLLALPEEKRNILIYIHGMWAHRDFFQEEVLTRVREDVLNDGSSPYGLVLSVIWHSGMNYHENVIHAFNVGEYYGPAIEQVLQLPANSVSVMAHSMGNRVFQGIYTRLDKSHFAEPPFDKILFIAADLEANIFDNGQPLCDIGGVCLEPIIYVHNNDRSLGLSRALNENERLGLNADASTCEGNPLLRIIDVSAVDDNEGFGPSLSNHRYFYTSPTVRKDLYYSLHGEYNPSREILNNPRRLKLSTKD